MPLFNLYPTYLYRKDWITEPGFNQRLYELAADDSLRNRVTDNSDPKAIGQANTHISHQRHNFLADYKDPVMKTFITMVDTGIREYLKQVYNTTDITRIEMMADTLWQRRSIHENVGIGCHTHPRADIVVTYYPKFKLDADCPNTPFHRGHLRVYDPTTKGKRHWPSNNPNNFYGGWFGAEPREGAMFVFEGHIPHDSSYFVGDERMCIPVLCDIITPKSHTKVSVEDLLALQDSETPHE